MTAVGRAPGQLDVLGGVGDYSGSLVLQTPMRAQTTVEIEPRDGYLVSSDGRGEVRFDTMDLVDQPRWTRYPLGCLRVFTQVKGWQPMSGLSIRIRSDVPASMGVSSSAALEVATLRALSELSGIAFDGLEIAHLARRAENEVVGVPCGLMDQLASAFGRPGAVLPILCRPDVLSQPVPLPAGVTVVGWPSGVTHDVGGSPYATARAASFMGKRILEGRLGRTFHYTSDIPSCENVPDIMTGAQFLTEHDGVDDVLSRIEPQREYPVRAATAFPIEEHARCIRAVELLCAGRLEEIGALMRVSHAGYGDIGLGNDETDRMVAHVYEAGPAEGFYGARISGGGAGGTVVVLLEEDAVGRLPGPVIR